MGARGTLAAIAAGAAFAAAIGLFVVRGPLRARSDSGDLEVIYLAARTWFMGADPYNADAVRAVAQRSTSLGKPEAYMHSVYPPATFVVMAPIAPLRWSSARDVWLAATICLVLAAFLATLRLAAVATAAGAFAAAAFLFAFAPVHTGMGRGNISTAVAAMIIIATACSLRGKGTVAAVLLGIAIALKPQLGVPFLFVEVAARRWRSTAIAIAIPVTLLIVGVLRSPQFIAAWPDELATNYRLFNAAGDFNGPTAANPYRFNLVNLEPLLYTMTDNASVVRWSIALLVLLTTLALVRFVWRGCDDTLLVASAVAVLSMLPLYRRSYDAVVLLLPFAWSLTQLRTRATARIALAALLPFLVPGAALLSRLAEGKPFTQAWIWNGIVMPHAIWCEIIIAATLLFELYRGDAHRRRLFPVPRGPM